MSNHFDDGMLSSAILQSIPRSGFAHLRLLIVGDVMLDRYIFGEVSRISPEAPVPVLRVKGQKTSAGGAANVALNVVGLKAQAALLGVVGSDETGRELTSILRTKNTDISGIVSETDRPTTCKTRVVCGNQQIVRMDEESSTPISDESTEKLFEHAARLLEQRCHAVVLSDYAKGVLRADLIARLMQLCSARAIPVLVDPKRSDLKPYRGAACITPNFKEFKEAARAFSLDDQQSLAALGSEVLQRAQSQALLVTQGAEGMTLFTGQQSFHNPALAEEVFDVSGAGDTVISTLAIGLAAGLGIQTAVRLANFAASLVVRHTGTVPIEWEELAKLLFAEGSKRAPQCASIKRSEGGEL